MDENTVDSHSVHKMEQIWLRSITRIMIIISIMCQFIIFILSICVYVITLRENE